MSNSNSGYSFRHALGQSAASHTTLSYLSEHFSHSTRDEWLARIQAQEILIDHSIATGEELLKPGGTLIWNRPGWVEPNVPMDYVVLYRDDYLLAVHKPSGLPTLPGAGFYRNTLLSQVQHEFPTATPLHRLGRSTSGIVLFAMDGQTRSVMSQRWERIQKWYRVLVQGIVGFESLCVRTPIGPIPHPRLGSIHGASWRGKPSRSLVEVMEHRHSTSLCSVELMTGRPHQIRIHLASIGHPLVGDPVYAVGGGLVDENPGLPGDAGYFLHAHRLRFQHPAHDVAIQVEAPLPDCLIVQ